MLFVTHKKSLDDNDLKRVLSACQIATRLCVLLQFSHNLMSYSTQNIRFTIHDQGFVITKLCFLFQHWNCICNFALTRHKTRLTIFGAQKLGSILQPVASLLSKDAGSNGQELTFCSHWSSSSQHETMNTKQRRPWTVLTRTDAQRGSNSLEFTRAKNQVVTVTHCATGT